MSKNAVIRYIVSRMTYTTLGRNSEKCLEVSSAPDLDKVVKKSKMPEIVDYLATWYNPWKAHTPLLESVIAEKEEEVSLAKINIDEQTELALDYNVGSVPILLAIKDGKVEEELVALQDADISKFVEKTIQEKSDGKKKEDEESNNNDKNKPNKSEGKKKSCLKEQCLRNLLEGKEMHADSDAKDDEDPK